MYWIAGNPLQRKKKYLIIHRSFDDDAFPPVDQRITDLEKYITQSTVLQVFFDINETEKVANNKVEEYFELWIDYCIKLKQSGHDLADTKMDEDRRTKKRPFEEEVPVESPKKKMAVEEKHLKKPAPKKFDFVKMVNQETDTLINKETKLPQTNLKEEILQSELQIKDAVIRKQELVIKQLTFKLAVLSEKVTSKGWVNGMFLNEVQNN